MSADESIACDFTLGAGAWRVDAASGELHGRDGTVRLEPKVMELLCLLASRPGDVLDRETLMAALWPGLVVGEDSLARAVSKLRLALGDDARAPRYIETLARRGYRLVAPVGTGVAARRDTPVGADQPAAADTASPAARTGRRSLTRRWRIVAPLAVSLLLAVAASWWMLGRQPEEPTAAAADRMAAPGDAQRAMLVARADDAYFQFSRADNEAAIELYQRVLTRHGDDPAALSGLANALVQRAVRWPQHGGDGAAAEFTRLGDALAHGHLERPPQRAQIERARLLAERAVQQAPHLAAAHKAAGFVASAQRRFDDALAAYQRSIELDPDAWGAMINIGDVLGLRGQNAQALPWFERAYAAMERSYLSNPAQVRPWQAALGVLIAEQQRQAGDTAAAESWFRRVLGMAPLDPAATIGLADLLRQGGDVQQAERLCQELRQRTTSGCE